MLLSLLSIAEHFNVSNNLPNSQSSSGEAAIKEQLGLQGLSGRPCNYAIWVGFERAKVAARHENQAYPLPVRCIICR
ncbi:MAG: hypothetical protein MUD16_18465 [Desulfobacterales bacterium]|nr:hypothetical protein [Desulfobacterales bacterium]